MTAAHTPENLTTWLELRALEHGTANQMERWMAKVLPEAELTALARKELYAGLDAFKRWQNVSDAVAERDITHTPACDYDEMPPTYVFETTNVDALTHDQWVMLTRLQEAVRGINAHRWCTEGNCRVTVVRRVHVARCVRCRRAVSYPTALVTAEWAGRTLTREYAL